MLHCTLDTAGYDLYAVLPNTNAPFRPRDVYRASFPRGTEKVDQDGGLDNSRMTVTRENARHETVKSSLFSSAKTRAKGYTFSYLGARLSSGELLDGRTHPKVGGSLEVQPFMVTSRVEMIECGYLSQFRKQR